MHVKAHNMSVHMQFCRKTLTKMRVHMGKTSGRAPPCRGGKEGGKGKRKEEEGKKKEKER